VLGPVLGGLLSGTSDFLGIAGWRWIFYINVPIAAAALVVVARVLNIDHARRERRIDWWGSLMLATGLVPLLVVAEQGHDWGWASFASFTCYFLGAAGLALFAWIQHRMGDDALLPLRLFRSPTFSVASGQVTIIGMAMFGGLSVLPLYLQIVKGASPTKSGLLLLPLVAGLMLASLGAGRLIARTGRYKIFPVAGSVLMVIGMGLLATTGADTPLWPTDTYMAIFGIGLGLNMQSLVLAMQNAVPAKDMGVASASSTFFRSVGGTLGTAIFLSILFSLADSKIGQQYAKAATDPAYLAAARAHPGQVASLHQHLGAGLDDTSFLNGLAKPLAHPFFAGLSSAGDVVFAVTAILLLAAIALSACLKEVPLRLVSGNQARAEAEPSASGPDSAEAHCDAAGEPSAPSARQALTTPQATPPTTTRPQPRRLPRASRIPRNEGAISTQEA
jgi:predicted MFS family arabinose efflux permease